MKRLSAITVLLLVSLCAAALAHEQTTFDKNDSPGPLDIAAARQKHRVLYEASSHPPRTRRVVEIRYRLLTHEKWKSDILTGDKNFIAIEFNFDDDATLERCIVIIHGEFEPNARLYRACEYSDDEVVRVLSAYRPDKHSMVVAIDRRHLKKGIGTFRWRAVTSFEDPDAAEDDPCWAGTFPSPGPYGVCADSTKWKRHRF